MPSSESEERTIARQVRMYAWDVYTSSYYAGIEVEEYRGRVIQVSGAEYHAYRAIYNLLVEYAMQEPELVEGTKTYTNMRDAIDSLWR